MSEMSKEEIQEQIRFHEGQGAWNRWSMRADRLHELVEMTQSWTDSEEILAVCPTMPAVLAGLIDAQRTASAKLESLAEFAPKPKRRKK